jgi:hypothetical protein
MKNDDQEAAAVVPEPEHLLQVLALVLETRSAALASGPVASGRRRYALPDADGEAVWDANVEALDAFASHLRSKLDCPVICPGGLRLPSWCARDYKGFFDAVMNRFIREAWFIDGWEYSTGSVLELADCLRAGRPVFDAGGVPLDRKKSITMVDAALTDVSAMGVDAVSLRRAFAVLRESA